MKLFSRIYGEGDPLIIIHGLFGMSDNWNTLGKRFSEHYNVHLVDLRNHGRSPHSDDFDYDVMCNDLHTYIHDKQLKNPILIGHSLGGKVAMKFLFSFPEIIEKVIVVDISPRRYNSTFFKEILASLDSLDIEKFSTRQEVDQALSLDYHDNGIRSFILKNLYRREDQLFDWRFNIKTLLEKIENIQQADFIDGTSQIPTHFIRGENSNYITIDDENLIREHFSDHSIVTIENAGHWVHSENPEGFYKEAIRLLA